MAVTVYTISNCPKCAAAKALLKRKGVAFEEFNVQENHEKKHEMIHRLLDAGLAPEETTMPVLDIGGTVLEGFDKERILAALKEKGLGLVP